MAGTNNEEPVRRYLAYLRDPSSVVDTETRDRLERELEGTDDPLRRLELRQRLADLGPEGAREEVERGFVAHARDYSEQSGISAEALKAEGVPDDVLVRAGLAPQRKSRGQAGKGTPRRAARVSRDQVRQQIERVKTPFTVKDIALITEGSHATVRGVVQDMHDEGVLEDVGPDKMHTGRGRAPRQYKQRAG